MLYFISYDLLRQGQDYKALTDELRRLGGKQVHLSVWSVRTASYTGKDLYEHLRGFVDSNDRLVVITATGAIGIGITPLSDL